MTPVLDALVKVMRNVHSCLMQQSVPSNLVKLWSQEVGLGSNSLGLLACELHLKTWLQESKVEWDPIVESECSSIGIEPSPE